MKRWRAPRKVMRSGDWGTETILLGSEYSKRFSYTELKVNGTADFNSTGALQIGIVTDGEGVLTWDGGEMPLKKADEVFFPCDIPNLKVSGDITIVLFNPEGVEI